MKDIALVYMVAGISSRFGGKIKALAKIGPENETLIEYSLNQALPAGFTKIIFIVSKQTEKPFKEKFGNFYKEIPVFYAIQQYDSKLRDKPWGTGDAICSAGELIKEPFIVANGDDIYGKKTFEILVNHLKTSEEDATVVTKLINMIPLEGTVSRGVFKADKNNYVTDSEEIQGIERKNFIEKGLNEEIPVNLGIFGLHPKTLNLLKEKLKDFKEKNKKDRKIEFYLNVKIAELIKEGKTKMKLYYTPEEWVGITNPEDEFKVKEKLKNLNKNN